jgi:hypothetical protein
MTIIQNTYKSYRRTGSEFLLADQKKTHVAVIASYHSQEEKSCGASVFPASLHESDGQDRGLLLILANS